MIIIITFTFAGVDPQITGSSFNATFDDNGNIIIPCGLRIGSITANKVKELSFHTESKQLKGEPIKEKEGESYDVSFLLDSSEYENLSNSNTYRCRILTSYRNDFTLRGRSTHTYT